MAQPLASVPRATPDAYGNWLADQEWNFDEDGPMAWVLNDDNRYLVEGVFEDSEERLVPNEEMKAALHLMQHAPGCCASCCAAWSCSTTPPSTTRQGGALALAAFRSRRELPARPGFRARRCPRRAGPAGQPRVGAGPG